MTAASARLIASSPQVSQGATATEGAFPDDLLHATLRQPGSRRYLRRARTLFGGNANSLITRRPLAMSLSTVRGPGSRVTCELRMLLNRPKGLAEPSA